MALDRAKARANAEKFLRANRVEEAIRELQKLAEDNPHDIQTLNQIGNLYLRVGKKEAAVPMFLKVAELYNKNGFATKAVASLKIATRESPENLAAWEMLAALSEQQGFAREARQAYDQVAQLVAKSGNLDAAIRIQRKIIELEPENLKVRIQLGDNLVKLGKTDEGVKEYIKSATQLMSQGLVKEATRLYERALQLGPDNLRVLEGLVKTYMARQQHEAAIKILDGLLEKHSTSEALLLLKIEVLSDLKQVAQAEQVCRQLFEAHPESATARPRLIRLLLIQQKYDEAAEMLSAWANECEAAKLPEAETLFEEILRFSPEHLPSLEGMAGVFRRANNNQRLSGVLTKLASTAEAQGKFDQARAALQELSQIEPAAAYKEKLQALEVKMGLRPKTAAPAPPPPPPKAPPAARLAPPPPDEEIPIEVESTGEVEIEIDMDDLQPKGGVPASEPAEERGGEAEAEMEMGMEVEVTAPMAKPRMASSAPAPLPPATGAEERVPTVEAVQPAPKPVMDARDAEVIRDQLTEAEVFLKYGLTEKAIAELQAVLKKVPDHVHAHQKLIAIYKKQKKPEKAARQIVRLAKVFRDQGEKDTYENLIEEARALDPNNPELQEFLEKATPPPASQRRLEAELLEAPSAAAVRPSAPPQPELERFERVRAKTGPPELDLGLLVPVPESKAAPQAEGLDLVVSLDEAAPVPGEATPVLEEPVLEPVTAEKLPAAEAGTVQSADAVEGELAEQMEEAEFYLSQELYGEAQRAVQSMEERWPAHTAVHTIRQRLNMALGLPSAPAPEGLRVSGLEEIELAQPPEEPREEVALDLGVETSSPLEVILPEEPALAVESTDEGVVMSEAEPEPAQEEELQVGFDMAGEPAGDQMPVEDMVADAIPFKETARVEPESEAAQVPGPEELFEKPAQRPAPSLSTEALLAGLSEVKRTKPKAAALPDISELLGPLTEKPAKTAVARLPEEPVEEAKGPAKLRLSLQELLPEEVVEKEQDVLKEEAKEDTKDEYYDLATELGAALEGLQSQEESLFEEEGKSPEEMSFEEVFEEFKKGVERKVSEEDASTHYNLGIAYKEMELLDEAIGEFQVAARSAQYFVECCSMLGICFRQKGLAELAEKWYRKGIESPGFSDEAYIGLKYDLAETLVEEGQKDQAARLYKEVYAVNANYRDIKDKVKGLKK